MMGETDLNTMLASMSPTLMEGEYVFLSFKGASYGDYAELNPLAAITEAEGLTLVVPKAEADRTSMHYESTFRGITLQVHSSLDAVGLTAAFSGKLGECGISANVIAGFYHDHIFVGSADAEAAMLALLELAQNS